MPESAPHKHKIIIANEINFKATHLCYPSGVYFKKYFSALESFGIESATTCEPGFVDFNSHSKMNIPRFLDGEDIPDIVFEAEMCGTLELLRNIKLFFNRIDR